MSSDQQPVLPNRQIPFSKAFTEFISTDWAPYSDELPEALPSTAHTASRRDKVSAMFPGERIVIPAGGYRVRSNDTDFRYRPHSAFAHLTGLGTDREPDAVLVLEPVAGGHEPCIYFSPRAPRTDPEFYSSSRYGEMWVGQRESLEELSAMTTLPTAPIGDLVAAVGTGADTIRIRVLRDADPDVTAMVDAARGDSAGTHDCDAELQVALSELRLVKDPFELEQMRAACRATATGFEAVVAELPHAVAAGRGERWVEGIFGLHARHAGNAVGYDTIAACGDHAATLHWVRNDGDLRNGELMLMDAGVELDSLYTADVTRTIPVSGRFTPAQRKVYEAVLEAQQAGIDAAKPGVKMRAIHDAASARLPCVDRIAVALYDAERDLLKTYVASPAEDSPLTRYEARLSDAPLLCEALRTGHPRVINDLSVLAGREREHTKRIAGHGYRASYAMALRRAGELLGFVFFDSRTPGAFDEEALRALDPFSHLVSLFVGAEVDALRKLGNAVAAARDITHFRDPETGAHVRRMAAYARLIARRMAPEHAFDDEAIERLTLFAPLHDVGKIGIPDRILRKPGTLTESERAVMQTHAEKGREIVNVIARDFGLDRDGALRMLENVAELHHEALDGSGYPRGLRGDEIPIEARIVAVADIFDALTSRRPYKEAWSNDRAFETLRGLAGVKIDAACVDALIASRAEVEEVQRLFRDPPGA